MPHIYASHPHQQPGQIHGQHPSSGYAPSQGHGQEHGQRQGQHLGQHQPPQPGGRQHGYPPPPHYAPPQQQPSLQPVTYAPDYAEFYADDIAGGPNTGRQPQPAPATAPAPTETEPRELVAHVREDTSLELKRTPIVPAGSVMGKSLTLVVTIMCFLACLTAGAVYMINESASAWLREVASEVTVQIEPRDKVDMERVIREVSAYLGRQPGIVTVKPMSAADSALLLEPWLGHSNALTALPMPRLLAVEVDRNQPPDFASLRGQLSKQFPAASLDDHRQWQQEIRAVTSSIALGGLAILLLVGSATTAIIVSATRSALASNREIVEVLHYVGATDRFIAREFERHFLSLGIRAGLVGAGCAIGVFQLMPLIVKSLGGGAITEAEMSRLVGSGALDMRGYLVLLGLVVVIAALCMLTSRIGVKRILRAQK